VSAAVKCANNTQLVTPWCYDCTLQPAHNMQILE